MKFEDFVHSIDYLGIEEKEAIIKIAEAVNGLSTKQAKSAVNFIKDLLAAHSIVNFKNK